MTGPRRGVAAGNTATSQRLEVDEPPTRESVGGETARWPQDRCWSASRPWVGWEQRVVAVGPELRRRPRCLTVKIRPSFAGRGSSDSVGAEWGWPRFHNGMATSSLRRRRNDSVVQREYAPQKNLARLTFLSGGDFVNPHLTRRYDTVVLDLLCFGWADLPMLTACKNRVSSGMVNCRACRQLTCPPPRNHRRPIKTSPPAERRRPMTMAQPA